ncbi:hypothetical protein BG011_010260 [Mortierella polycephala]|uniref:Uncharacterized protein n=1 Tax=Mortierella polycephala TaxID=41804 RepID=A0A9P6TV33_9FUNG|nr:hypothetical protein BG011_010260 [Mortierella polycephala]
MAVISFDLTVTSTSTDVEHLMIILNPNLIMNTGKNYESYFPVAWKVLIFSSNEFPQKPAPITISYKSDVTAIIQQIDSGNIVTAADYEPIQDAGTVFDITLDQDVAKLVDTKKRRTDFTTVIVDKQQNPYYVGLGDSHAKSYLTMQVQPENAIGFKYTPEFAIVPVGKTVEGSKVVSGTTLKPWFSFNLDDVTNTSPSITYDGEKIASEDGINTTSHGADEEVFGGGPEHAQEPPTDL